MIGRQVCFEAGAGSTQGRLKVDPRLTKSRLKVAQRPAKHRPKVEPMSNARSTQGLPNIVPRSTINFKRSGACSICSYITIVYCKLRIKFRIKTCFCRGSRNKTSVCVYIFIYFNYIIYKFLCSYTNITITVKSVSFSMY